MQVVVAVLAVSAGMALGFTGWLGWRAALPRNRFVGVRTPAAMASDPAFRMANRVAGPVLVAAGAVGVLGGVAVLAAPSGAVLVVILAVVLAGVLGLALAAGVLGSRAAEAAPARQPGCAGCACAGGLCQQ